MPHKYVRVDGVATLLRHRGPTTLPEVVPDLSRGELVLCLHGAGDQSGVFGGLLDALAAAHSPLAFDQPGHGRSGGLDSLGVVDRMVDFTRALVGKLGLRAPLVLGHGLGAAVALQWAQGHPDELRGLVVVGAALRHDHLAGLRDEVRSVVQGRARRPFLRGSYAKAAPGDVLQRGFGESLRTDPRAVLGDLEAALAWRAERLEGLALPTCVVVGEDETPELRGQADELVAALAGALRVEIPGAGHMAPFEQPAAVADAVGRLAGALA
jgi:3-oxoadipate enol-lactonase/4-carboxymuconolactone decarboxylase